MPTIDNALPYQPGAKDSDIWVTTLGGQQQYRISAAELQLILEAREAPKPMAGLINTANFPAGFRHGPWTTRPSALICNSLLAAEQVLLNLGNKSGQERRSLIAKAQKAFASGFVVVVVLDTLGHIASIEHNQTYCANGTCSGL